MKIIAIIAALTLAGCATQPPISGNIGKDVVSSLPAPTSGPSLQGTVTQGLLDASYNLDNAVTVGALDANDPAPACLHAVLKDIGIDPSSTNPAAPSFTPKVSDLISAGSVLYIRARQLEHATGSGITMTIPCKAIVGQMVIDAGAAAKKATGLAGASMGLGIPLPILP